MMSQCAGRRIRQFSRLALLLAMAAALCTACTIVRDPPPENNSNDSNSNGAEAPKVDMLVVAQIDQNSAELSPYFEQIVRGIGNELAKSEIGVQRLALAPLYRQADGVVPLLYGEGDEDSEFSSLSEAIVYYGRDEGTDHLRQAATGESENLAALGMHLDERAVYRSSGSDPSGRPYFGAAPDGLVVVVFSATERKCGLEQADCKLDGESPVDYFTSTDDREARWLSFSGSEGVDARRVYHAAIATTEGVDGDTFEAQCKDRSGFPATTLDFMEHSPNEYYVDLAKGVSQNGSRGSFVDLCQAMSNRGDVVVKSLAGDIAGMF